MNLNFIFLLYTNFHTNFHFPCKTNGIVTVHNVKIRTFSSVGYKGGTKKTHTWTWSALACIVLVCILYQRICAEALVWQKLMLPVCCRYTGSVGVQMWQKLMCCLCVAGTGSVLTGWCAPTVTGVRAAPSRPSCAGTTGTVSGDGSVHQGQELQLPHSFYFRW